MLCKVAFAAVALACAAVGGRAQTPTLFQADIEVYNDPGMFGGVSGKMYYRKAQAPNVQRIDYDVVGAGYTKVIEVIDFTNQFRYLYCTKCEAETYRKAMPDYSRPSGTTTIQSRWPTFPNSFTDGARTCTGRVVNSPPAQGAVIAVYSDQQNLPCRVILDDGSKAGTHDVGRHIDFTNVASVTVNNAAFNVASTWSCPAPICSVKIDLFLVFDESGSVGYTPFQQEKQFGIDVVNSYTIGANNVRVGLSVFASGGRLVFGLSGVKTNIINKIAGLSYNRGYTCIPCGVKLARDNLISAGRSGVGKVIITVTDGYNNVDTNQLQSTITSCTSRGYITFGVGVGSSVSQSQLLVVAGGVTARRLNVGSFSQLSTLLQQLVTETCTDLPGNPCGPTCRGFCACSQTCLCPTNCKSSDVCKDGVCTAGQNGNGCVLQTKNCADTDECTDDTCTYPNGCTHTAKVCDDLNKCTVDTCNSNIQGGCQFVPKVCDDGDPCTADKCIAGNGAGAGCDNSTKKLCDKCKVWTGLANCKRPDKCVQRECNETLTAAVCIDVSTTDCDDNNLCTTEVCDPVQGCVYTPVVCDDGNACTLDTCNATRGCVHTPINCDDYNNCTTDTCDPASTTPPNGCIYTPITCTDNDICTDDTCDSILGCQYPAKDCSKVPEIARFQGNCHFAFCNATKGGCYLEHIPGTAKVDKCGFCGGDGSRCTPKVLDTSAAVGIGAGFVALIIIGAIALCAALAFIGGKKGYDVYMRNKGSMFGATSSPLYDSANLAGESPMYEGQP